MGFLRRLLGATETTRTVDATLMEPRRADAAVHIVGEGNYQPWLLRVAGGRTPDGPANPEHVAVLVPEPNNRYDENAIAVQIEARTVGYLDRETAIEYGALGRWSLANRKYIACHAFLTGGWDRGRRDQGSIGVVLHLGSPAECMLELFDDEISLRLDHPWFGWLVAFTGDSRYECRGFPLDRGACETLATMAGLTFHPRVTKKVQLLVDCEPGTTSGNETKARDYGIPVVSEVEFWAAIGLQVEATDRRPQRPAWQTSQ